MHGRDAAEQAAETARKTFEEGAIADTLPTVDGRAAELEGGIGILSLFVTAGLAASNGEARRHVQGGAVRVNDQPVTDERRVVSVARSDRRRRDQAVARQEEAHPGHGRPDQHRTDRTGPIRFDAHRNSKIERKMPGAITDSGLICSVRRFGVARRA